MSDFLTDFLASILAEEGCPNPREVAAKAAADLRKFKIIRPFAVVRAQIQADPCRDYKVIMRRYHVSRGFVFQCWNSQSQEA